MPTFINERILKDTKARIKRLDKSIRIRSVWGSNSSHVYLNVFILTPEGKLLPINAGAVPNVIYQAYSSIFEELANIRHLVHGEGIII